MIQNYSDPIVTLNQVYAAQTTGTTPILGACVIGPNYLVRDFDDLGDKLRLDSAENYPSGEYNTTFTPSTGLTARPYPATQGDDGDVVTANTTVLVRSAVLQYDEFAVDGTSDSIAFFVDTDGNTQYDTIQIKENGSAIIFTGTWCDLDVAVETGDAVQISGTVSDSDVVIDSQVLGFLKDSQNKYSGCVLSKELPTSLVFSKVAFRRTTTGYVNASNVTKTKVDDVDYVGVATNAKMTVTFGELPNSYPIISGEFYAEYKVASNRYVGTYGMVAGELSVADILGKVCALNPLGVAVAAAAAEAGSRFVFFTAIDTSGEELTALVTAYTEAADLMSNINGVYGIVPCTDNAAVLKALLSYVNEQSAEEIPFFKFLYGSCEIVDLVVIDGVLSVTGTVSNKTVKFASSPFLTSKYNPVKGDILRVKQGSASTDYIITGSNNKDSVTTYDAIDTSGTGTPYFTVYHKFTNNNDIVQYLVNNKVYADKRGSITFADGVLFNGEAVGTYVAAAAIAGLRSNSQPQAPLSNVQITAVQTTEAHGFTASQLKTLGAYGFWRIGSDSQGVVISRRQLTSAAADDVNYDEQSIICTVDSVCLQLKNVGTGYVGNSNITTALISQLSTDLTGMLKSFTQSNDTFIGPRLISATLDSIQQDSVNKDRIYAVISGEPPKPFNRFTITFYMK